MDHVYKISSKNEYMYYSIWFVSNHICGFDKKILWHHTLFGWCEVHGFFSASINYKIC